MSIKNSKEIEEMFVLRDHLKIGEYVDALDTVRDWKVGQIIDVHKSKKHVQIHFDGWNSKWDVWYKVTSYKLAPFRKLTSGYTGMKSKALRTNWKLSRKKLNEIKKLMETITESNFNFESLQWTPYRITQEIRGRIFICIDAI